MFQQEDILAVIKKAHAAKLPEWKKTYYERIANNLQVHTKGLLFSKVDTLFPHEHPDSKAHCVNTYEPITKGSIWKGLNNLIRIYSNSSFTVSASDETLEYANKPLFDGSNLFNWFLEEWVKNAVATDSNGLCVVYPPAYIEKNGDVNKPDIVRFIKSEHVLQLPDGEMCVFISELESDKTESVSEVAYSREVFYDQSIGTNNARTIVSKTYNQKVTCKINKPVYHVFTKEFFLKFTEENGTYTYELYSFDAPVKMLSVFAVGGTELFTDIFESFVQPFVPFGNLALLSHRNHRAVDLSFSYPRMSEIQTPCDNLNCRDGEDTTRMIPTSTDGESVAATCTRCKGSGWITAQSPYKIYQKKLDSGLTDPEVARDILNAPVVEYYTPDTAILEYSKNAWKDYLKMAEEAIFIQQKVMTGNVEAAKSKEYDREELYAFLQNISKVFYDRLRMVLQAFENYLIASPLDCTLETPTSFAILTESEAFDGLNVIINSKAPVFVIAQQVENFINKFVSKSSPIIKALRILKQVDPLLFYSTSEIQAYKSNNAVNVDQWTTHIYAYPVLMQFYEADKNLFDKADAELITLLTTAIDKLKPAPPVDLKTTLLSKVA
jgi:hypothetical protein